MQMLKTREQSGKSSRAHERRGSLEFGGEFLKSAEETTLPPQGLKARQEFNKSCGAHKRGRTRQLGRQFLEPAKEDTLGILLWKP